MAEGLQDTLSLSIHNVSSQVRPYTRAVPQLWNETIEAHRRDVRDAILDTTAAVVTEHGRRAATMSRIAEQTGIGRATLYKYFPDVDAILHAWHHRHIAAHLERLTELRDRENDPDARLEAVLTGFALIAHERSNQRYGAELTSFLHGAEHVAEPLHRLRELVRAVLADAAATGRVRTDVDPDELVTYCLHALGAAGGLPSAAAVHRLVTVTLAGLRPS
jgi:AcrR family transcriptional regulator